VPKTGFPQSRWSGVVFDEHHQWNDGCPGSGWGSAVIGSWIWIPLGRSLGVTGGSILVGGFATSGLLLY